MYVSLSPSSCFPLTRLQALSRLDAFLPDAGESYARERNYDFGSLEANRVSGLSPALRRRLVTEQEVVEAVLKVHGLDAAESFIREVCWRSYWKGWLEQHPGVWREYMEGIRVQSQLVSEDAERFSRLQHARKGETGLECFDAWVEELCRNGYLHNHARMWFAAIWIHTLGLPWELGAAFFAFHLLDADPASNTLSWRWVAGLHTQGKSYAARASNIRKFTGGRFQPGTEIEPNFPAPAFQPPSAVETFPLPSEPVSQPFTLLLCPEDLALDQPSSLRDGVEKVVLLRMDPDLEPDLYSPQVRDAEKTVREDAALQWKAYAPVEVWTVSEFKEHSRSGLSQASIRMPWVPTGIWQDQLEKVWRQTGVRPDWVVRQWDRTAWPLAGKGFFWFWKKFRLTLMLDP